MTFNYRTHEASISLPGEVAKDESMNIVHFLNEAGNKRRMIISRELLAEHADFAAVVNDQIQALKQDKLIRLDAIESMTLSAANWPAVRIDAFARIGQEQAWQLHLAFYWKRKYLVTISLNAQEEMPAEEKKSWIRRIEAAEFSL